MMDHTNLLGMIIILNNTVFISFRQDVRLTIDASGHFQICKNSHKKSNNIFQDWLKVSKAELSLVSAGGASGIGFETARVLALRNAHVIIAARNLEAANEAKQIILKDNSNARFDVLKLDLASLKSVKAFSDNFVALNLPLSILINNAGLVCPYKLSEDGIEMQFATNHLGHFYLTNLLLDKMKDTAKSTGIEGRIVNISSVGHIYTYPGGIAFEQINDKNSYDYKKAYGQSKLANILHANELSQRLQIKGVNITVNSVHPGRIMTDIQRFWDFDQNLEAGH